MNGFTDTVLNEHVIRIEVPGDVYVYLIKGEKSALLADTGLGAGSLKEHIEELTCLPYEVVLTHGHVDHAGGAGEFPAVRLCAADRAIAEAQTQKDVRLGYLGGGYTYEDLIDPPAPDVFRDLAAGEVFDLGGIHAEIFALPGHTPGSVCILIQEERMILLGDACNSAAYLQLDHSLPLHVYRENLIRFMQETDRLYDTPLYSHPHNRGGKEILPQMADLCTEIIEGKVSGMRRPDVIGPNTYEAYPSGADQMRTDGMLANLMFNPDNL